MSQHIQFTMIIFFINIMLTFLFPQYTFIEDNIYEIDSYGNAVTDGDYIDSIGGSLSGDGSSAVSSFGVLDALLVIWDFIKYIFSFIIALPVLIFMLPVEMAVKVLFFFPVLLLYSFALMGWIRRG